MSRFTFNFLTSRRPPPPRCLVDRDRIKCVRCFTTITSACAHSPLFLPLRSWRVAHYSSLIPGHFFLLHSDLLGKILPVGFPFSLFSGFLSVLIERRSARFVCRAFRETLRSPFWWHPEAKILFRDPVQNHFDWFFSNRVKFSRVIFHNLLAFEFLFATVCFFSSPRSLSSSDRATTRRRRRRTPDHDLSVFFVWLMVRCTKSGSSGSSESNNQQEDRRVIQEKWLY